MSFSTKPQAVTVEFGPHAGKPISEWPDEYLAYMAELARDGRFLNRNIRDRIIREHDKRNE